jgi:hypothetical protein
MSVLGRGGSGCSFVGRRLVGCDVIGERDGLELAVGVVWGDAAHRGLGFAVHRHGDKVSVDRGCGHQASQACSRWEWSLNLSCGVVAKNLN